MKKVPKYTIFLLIKLLKSSSLRFARARCFRESNAEEIRGGNSSTSGETDVIHAVGDNRFSSRKKKTAVFSRSTRKAHPFHSSVWSESENSTL